MAERLYRERHKKVTPGFVGSFLNNGREFQYFRIGEAFPKLPLFMGIWTPI